MKQLTFLYTVGYYNFELEIWIIKKAEAAVTICKNIIALTPTLNLTQTLTLTLNLAQTQNLTQTLTII